MLLGYNTNGFASHSLDGAIRVIGGLGYRSIAITLDHGALNPFAPDLTAQIAACRERLAEHRLACVIETGARFLLDPWRKHRPTLLEDDDGERQVRIDFLTRAIDVAAELGAGVVSLWSGASDHASPSREKHDDRLLVGLTAVCDAAAARGVVIGFEPEPGMYIESMADFDRIATLVNHPALKLTLDVGHAHLTEAAGAADTVRLYRDWIVNVHLEGMARPVHDHLLPWEGDMDLRGVVDALREVGYAGPATFELSRHSHAAVDVARRALAYVQPAS